eukprot:g1959.t1
MEDFSQDQPPVEDYNKECRVYLGNLSWGTDQDMLNDFICQTVAPIEVVIAQTKTGRSLGYAIATMVSAGDAQAVIANCNEQELDGRRLIVRGDNESPGQKKTKKKKKKKPAADQDSIFQQPVVEEDPALKACRAYIGNLAWEADNDGLSQFLAAYAVPMSVEVAVTNSGRSLGYAIVTFNSPEEASNVIASCNDLEFLGRPLICREDREAPGGKKKRRNRNRNRNQQDGDGQQE